MGVLLGSARGWEVLGPSVAVLEDDRKSMLIKLAEVVLGGIAVLWKGETELKWF